MALEGLHSYISTTTSEVDKASIEKSASKLVGLLPPLCVSVPNMNLLSSLEAGRESIGQRIVSVNIVSYCWVMPIPIDSGPLNLIIWRVIKVLGMQMARVYMLSCAVRLCLGS